MKIKLGPTKELLRIIEAEKRNAPIVLAGNYCIQQDGSLKRESSEDNLNDENTSLSLNSKKRKVDEDLALADNLSPLSDDLNDEENAVPKSLRIPKILEPKKIPRNPLTPKNYIQETRTKGQIRTSPVAHSSNTNPNEPMRKEELPKNNFLVSRERDDFTRYETIEMTLKRHPQGEEVINAARTILGKKDRTLLVRILIAELVATHNDNYYPPANALEGMAKALVKEFPLLKQPNTEKGYEHYYDPLTHRGFFLFRLLTMRKHLDVSKKKYKGAARKMTSRLSSNTENSEKLSNNLSKDELLEKINFLKFTHPTRETKSDITEGMKVTFPARKNWIHSESPNIVAIIEQYPRLIDFNGLLIDVDFELEFPGKGKNFISKFPAIYVPRILKYTKASNPLLLQKYGYIPDDNLKALLILTELIPTSNAGKKSNGGKGGRVKSSKTSTKEVAVKITPQKCLLEFVSDVESVQDFSNQKRQKMGTPIQPYIVAIQGRNTLQFQVQGDGCIVAREQSREIIPSFDLLFKIFYVFNLTYPVSLTNFYLFIQVFIYELQGKCPESVLSLYTALSSIDKQADAEHSSTTSEEEE